MNKAVIFGTFLAIVFAFFFQINSQIVSEKELNESSQNNSEKSSKIPSICDNALIINDTNGNFEKTACFIEDKIYRPSPYDEAAEICIKNGMKLYKFDSIESYNGWFKLANSMWKPDFGACVWVNGKRDDCRSVFKIVEDGEEHRILGKVQFRDSQMDCGKCMRMAQDRRGGFNAVPSDCKRNMSFFCEFRLKEVNQH